MRTAKAAAGTIAGTALVVLILLMESAASAEDAQSAGPTRRTTCSSNHPAAACALTPRQGAVRRGAVFYRNCTEARAAGAAPIMRGESGYAPHLDRDNDGIACEPYRGR